MKVELINYTQDAAELLIFTKQTRLELSPGLFDEIKNWHVEKKQKELEYMANTIPSSWEFVDYTFLVTGVSRAYTHQQVRTRAGSYAQQTMRVTDMSDFEYVFSESIEKSPLAEAIVRNCLASISSAYRSLIEIGQEPEDARGILPTNIATNIICKFNLRTMTELAKSRTGGRTQGEYQAVINAMIDAILVVHPWAEKFLFQQDRDLFNEIEEFAKREFPDLKKRGELLKIVDHLRKKVM